ncbi:TIGR02186 family protein [Roseicitreum antarcticum]|uniref:Transmembrane protein (Alph_Pro_TM) n=1 Tax=Roseicitreum antarcticum TaxID=564137 RepID=A0A1H2XBQ2_9RHOB|nr:TIGR02186 family protein [Roseicitreum antarcticum]SDW90362.1 conserved hypothetical protein [Roseicitreum antarcticum]
MRLIFGMCLMLLALTQVARAEGVVAGLSQNNVSLTANFRGSEILVFGAITRETPIDADAPLDVIVTVEGPPSALTVWRKERRAGIWVNVDSVRIRTAPSFYAVASSGPLDEILSFEADTRNRISIRRAIYEARRDAGIENPGEFTEALIRIRENASLYQDLGVGVEIDRNTLFRTTINLPKNLVEGTYVTNVFLIRNGAVIDRYQTQIYVQKAVFERWLYNLAYEYPPLYAGLALLMAVFFGWGASALFRLIRS